MIRPMLDTDQPPLMLAKAFPRTPLAATYADLVDAPMLGKLAAAGWEQVILIDRGLGDLTGRASIIDVEAKARTPADVPKWYDEQHGKGIRYLTTYCNQTTLPAVDAAMGDREFWRWVARLDGVCWIPGHQPGHAPAAIQTTNAAWLGFHADLSLVFEDNWHPQPAPAGPDVPQAVRTAADHLATIAGELAATQQLLRQVTG
jgi:hypothetical protein